MFWSLESKSLTCLIGLATATPSFLELGDHSSMRWRSLGNVSDARRVPPCTWMWKCSFNWISNIVYKSSRMTSSV